MQSLLLLCPSYRLCEARSAVAIPQTKYVILSVSEISHDRSEKYIPPYSFGGILHCV